VGSRRAGTECCRLRCTAHRSSVDRSDQPGDQPPPGAAAQPAALMQGRGAHCRSLLARARIARGLAVPARPIFAARRSAARPCAPRDLLRTTAVLEEGEATNVPVNGSGPTPHLVRVPEAARITGLPRSILRKSFMREEKRPPNIPPPPPHRRIG